MEKQFIDLVVHVFTAQWAIWALPLSIILSLIVNRVIPGLVVAVLAVVLHHVAPIAIPALLGGESFAVIAKDISDMIPKLEPISLVAEYVAYAFLIVVFSLQRQDMMRHRVAD